jgi:hypothetical protein
MGFLGSLRKRFENFVKRLFPSGQEIPTAEVSTQQEVTSQAKEKEEIKKIKKEGGKSVFDYIDWEKDKIISELGKIGKYYLKTKDKGLREIFEALLLTSIFKEGGIYSRGGMLYLDEKVLEDIFKKSLGDKYAEELKKEWSKRICDRINSIASTWDMYTARLTTLLDYSQKIRVGKGMEELAKIERDLEKIFEVYKKGGREERWGIYLESLGVVPVKDLPGAAKKLKDKIDELYRRGMISEEYRGKVERLSNLLSSLSSLPSSYFSNLSEVGRRDEKGQVKKESVRSVETSRPSVPSVELGGTGYEQPKKESVRSVEAEAKEKEVKKDFLGEVIKYNTERYRKFEEELSKLERDVERIMEAYREFREKIREEGRIEGRWEVRIETLDKDHPYFVPVERVPEVAKELKKKLDELSTSIMVVGKDKQRINELSRKLSSLYSSSYSNLSEMGRYERGQGYEKNKKLISMFLLLSLSFLLLLLFSSQTGYFVIPSQFLPSIFIFIFSLVVLIILLKKI